MIVSHSKRTERAAETREKNESRGEDLRRFTAREDSNVSTWRDAFPFSAAERELSTSLSTEISRRQRRRAINSG